MKRLALAVLVSVAALAAGSAPRAVGGPDLTEVTFRGYVHDFNPGMWIGGESDPAGFVLSPQRANEEGSLPRIAYLDGQDAGIDLATFQRRFCIVHGMLEKDALTAGGVETPSRSFDVLHVIDIQGTTAPRKFVDRLPGRILADLAARGIDFGRDGADAPSGGLTADGMIDGRRVALVIPLVVPPEDSADMFTDTAFVDRRGRRYWALRTGGFAGVVQWVGPFDLVRHRKPAELVFPGTGGPVLFKR